MIWPCAFLSLVFVFLCVCVAVLLLTVSHTTYLPQATRSGGSAGECEAFFLFQRVKAESLLKGTWHRSKWSARAYGNAHDAGCEDDDDDAGDDEQAGETVGGGDDGDETTASGAKKAGEMHKYEVPRLNSLPHDVSRRDRVIALTCFKVHGDHPPEVGPSKACSQSTNTQNLPGSAGEIASNNTCK